jgi:RNA-directed DNA polymerase
MKRQTEVKVVSVSKRTKQTAETYAQWSWVEPNVWTERMLTALEQGVKGGKWFSLIDKVYSKANLYLAFNKVKRNKGVPGVDHITIEMFEKHLEKNVEHLHVQLKKDLYQPQAIRRKYIPKPGKRGEMRPLGIIDSARSSRTNCSTRSN